MTDILPEIRVFLEQANADFEVWDCDPAMADTVLFCEHYGVAAENSANTILVKSKAGEPRFAVCVLLAVHRLNVNHCVRKNWGEKVSFASAEQTREITGMEIGGVAPLALPQTTGADCSAALPVWVDANVMKCDYIILGGGNRTSKLKVHPSVLHLVPGMEVVEGLVQ